MKLIVFQRIISGIRSGMIPDVSETFATEFPRALGSEEYLLKKFGLRNNKIKIPDTTESSRYWAAIDNMNRQKCATVRELTAYVKRMEMRYLSTEGEVDLNCFVRFKGVNIYDTSIVEELIQKAEFKAASVEKIEYDERKLFSLFWSLRFVLPEDSTSCIVYNKHGVRARDFLLKDFEDKSNFILERGQWFAVSPA